MTDKNDEFAHLDDLVDQIENDVKSGLLKVSEPPRDDASKDGTKGADAKPSPSEALNASIASQNDLPDSEELLAEEWQNLRKSLGSLSDDDDLDLASLLKESEQLPPTLGSVSKLSARHGERLHPEQRQPRQSVAAIMARASAIIAENKSYAESQERRQGQSEMDTEESPAADEEPQEGTPEALALRIARYRSATPKRKGNPTARALGAVLSVGFIMVAALYAAFHIGRELTERGGQTWIMPLSLILGMLAGFWVCFILLRPLVRQPFPEDNPKSEAESNSGDDKT